MTRRPAIIRLVAMLATAIGLTMAFSSSASAGGGSTQQLGPTAEAWYQVDPTCSLATGCLSALSPVLSLVPTSAVKVAGTLQVGEDLGLEVARSYLAVPFAKLGDATITAATLTVPLDVSVADGSVTPQLAKVEVCLATAVIQPVAGSTKTPPGTNCDPHVDLTYQAKPAPQLQGNLKPLLPYLEQARGLALLPDRTGAGVSDEWRVVFSAHNRTGTGHTAAASVAVTTPGSATVSPRSTPTATPTIAADSGGSQSGGSVNVPVPGVALPPSGQTTSAPAPAPVIASTGALPDSQLAGSRRLLTRGFAYPGVLLLPLLLAGLGLVTVRCLGKDMTPDQP